MEKSYFSPAEIAENFIETGCKKADLAIFKQLVLGILGGAFIALAAQGSNVAIHTISSVGLSKVLAGTIFSSGLMMVIIAGAELFTGNCLMVISCSSKGRGWLTMLRGWLFVYLGNFIGAMIVVLFVHFSGQLNFSNGLLGGYTIKIAVSKSNMTFGNAFFMGILCNWLVCLAIWMSAAAKDITGKLFAILFPIWLFVTSGFEHSIANMYYIPAGILSKSNPAWVNATVSLGVAQEKINGLSWGAFLIKNLIPVTLGNIVGGGLFVGMIYWVIYLHKHKIVKENYHGL